MIIINNDQQNEENDLIFYIQIFDFSITFKNKATLKLGKTLPKNMYRNKQKVVFFQPNVINYERNDFLCEAAIIGQFTHPNIIALEGVILKGIYIQKHSC